MLLAARPTLPNRAVKARPRRWEGGGSPGPGNGAGQTWLPGRAAGSWGERLRPGLREGAAGSCPCLAAQHLLSPGCGCKDTARPRQPGWSIIPHPGCGQGTGSRRVWASGAAGSAPLSARVSERESEASPFTDRWGSPLSNWLRLWKSKATGRIWMSDRSWQHHKQGSAPHKALRVGRDGSAGQDGGAVPQVAQWLAAPSLLQVHLCHLEGQGQLPVHVHGAVLCFWWPWKNEGWVKLGFIPRAPLHCSALAFMLEEGKGWRLCKGKRAWGLIESGSPQRCLFTANWCFSGEECFPKQLNCALLVLLPFMVANVNFSAV